MKQPLNKKAYSGRTDETAARSQGEETPSEKKQNAREHDEPNPEREPEATDPPADKTGEVEKKEFPQEKKPVKKS